jgi:hypothetical protein
MAIEQYDVFFSGAIMEGRDETEVRTKVGQLFKASGGQLERLFSGQPVRIKASVDLDTAVKYRVAFRDAGALVDIKPAATSDDKKAAPQATPSPASPGATPTAPETEEIELLPPRTGSLIDCAQKVTPAPIPDISSISMDEAGVTLDETAPPPPLEIDTSELSAETGSLEDYQQPVEPAQIPDISGITASEPNTGSLEDCYQPVEPAKIPDISAIELADSEEEK